MVKSMCNEAKLQEVIQITVYVHLELHAELFLHDTPEHVIHVQQFTGHRCVRALRQYEKVASEQQKAACNILTGASSNDFSTEVKQVNDLKKSN